MRSKISFGGWIMSVLGGWLLGLSGLRAQAPEPPVEKVYLDWQVWPTWQADWRTAKGSYWWLQATTAHTTTSGLSEIFGPWGMYRSSLLLGYEQALNTKLRLGISLKSLNQRGSDRRQYRGFVRHNGHISKWWFVKQFSLEYVRFPVLVPVRQEDYWAAGLFAALGRDWPLGAHHLRTGLSFEAFKELDSPPPGSRQRRIDRTMFRLSAEYLLKNGWSAGLFAMRQTDYYFSLAQFDASGAQIKPLTRLNLVSPILGIQVRYTFRATKPDWDPAHIRVQDYTW